MLKEKAKKIWKYKTRFKSFSLKVKKTQKTKPILSAYIDILPEDDLFELFTHLNEMGFQMFTKKVVNTSFIFLLYPGYDLTLHLMGSL